MEEAAKLISSSSLWLETGGQGQDTLMKDVGEIFQSSSQAGSVPTPHNCHWFPVKRHRAFICIFKNLYVFEYLLYSDQKQPVWSLTAVTTSLI